MEMQDDRQQNKLANGNNSTLECAQIRKKKVKVLQCSWREEERQGSSVTVMLKEYLMKHHNTLREQFGDKRDRGPQSCSSN